MQRGVGDPSVEGAGDAEVEDFRLAVFGDENVGGLQVAMHDAPVVGMLYGRGDPTHQRQAIAGAELLPGRIGRQRFTTHQLHGKVRTRRAAASRLEKAGFVNLGDPVVLQSAEQFRLPLKASGDRVCLIARRDHFERDRSPG